MVSMFTRSPVGEPTPLEPLKNANASPSKPPQPRSGSTEPGKSVISNDLKILGQDLSGFEDRCPLPLAAKRTWRCGAGSENRTRVFCLEGSGSAIELRPAWRMVQGSNLRDPKG